ncbi:hypothetical protein PILCRDRAFT_815520 [Piloderma croceum F 1598]|uniref:Uncharacterized protein n=1 Tax=Piloderma croceum (strain F 1598) TaxID=765440 RepID=A0A0C3BKU0_PILCF|nr:hypothetical protein PILCRDRAFT_815520 [Piloderma croceum F 1598]
MATMVLTRTEGSLTTEIPRNGMVIEETPAFTAIAPRGRQYIPSSQRTAVSPEGVTVTDPL